MWNALFMSTAPIIYYRNLDCHTHGNDNDSPIKLTKYGSLAI